MGVPILPNYLINVINRLPSRDPKLKFLNNVPMSSFSQLA
jgi:hypothetical protein